MIYIDESGNLNLSKLHENQKAFIRSTHLHTGIVGGYQCLPFHTEYLSPTGWERIDNYKGGEILIFDEQTNETRFETPLRYINQPGGKFIQFKTDTLEMEVTPNHRVLYSTEKNKRYRVELASKLNNRVRIPRTFNAPDLVGINLTEPELRLQVAISADGSFERKTRVRFNLKKERKKQRLLNLLQEARIEYKIYNNNTGDGYLKISFVPPILTKDLSFLFKANKKQLAIIADECRYWDGSVYDCGSIEVSGIDKKSLDLIQYAITTTGKAASLLCTDKREYKTGKMWNVREYKHNYSGLRYCTKKEVEYDRQYCFTVSTGFFIVRQKGNIFITGNSGKSTAAVIKAFTHLLRFPHVPIAYYLPTFRLFDDMLVPKFKELFESLNVPYKHNQTKSKLICPYGEVWMRSMDEPDSIVSYSVGYSIVDEVDLVHPNKRSAAMKRISSRNSFKKPEANQIDFVSTPEGFAYMYEFFVKKANPNKLLLQLSTMANESNLADGYIQGLREQYTEEQLRAYLSGEFVNLTSDTVYYKFSRDVNNSDRTYKPGETIHVGLDFNVGNMHAVVHVVDDKPIAVDEIVKAYDTDQICRIIKDRYQGSTVNVYPDASGGSRKTSSSTTDIQILKDAGFYVHSAKTNPAVKDRVANMNRMFCDGNGKVNYFVNKHKCPNYVEALEKLAYDKNGEPDKSSGFDHITEAGGYFIWNRYQPIQRHKGHTAL